MEPVARALKTGPAQPPQRQGCPALSLPGELAILRRGGGSRGKRLAGNEWGWWLTARPSDPELLVQGQRASALLMTELSLTGHHGIMQDQTQLSLP